MPPRKSTSSVTPADQEPEAEPSSSPRGTPSQSQSQGQVTATEQQIKARAEGGVNVEDHLLPRSLTIRLAKSVLPPNTTIQKDAVLAIQKAATVFVSYLSSHANDATLKRTVAPPDVFSAISELEFGAFRDRLEKELDAYTELKAGKRKKGGAGGASTAGVGQGDPKGKEEEDDDDENAARGTKRTKRVKRGGVAGGQDGEGEGKGAGGGGDGDDTQGEQENEDEDEEEVPEGEDDGGEDDEEDDEEDEDQEEKQDDEDDINRVEDLDRDSRAKRTMDPDAAGDDSDTEDETGPGQQLREDMGLG